jgi:two-component system phosphate regulon response regulator PhoB
MTPSVLVCDDEPHVTRLIDFKLDRAGFNVQTAVNAETAWRLLHRKTPDLLILDYRMPGMDGLPFLEQLRQDASYADVPVMMLIPPDVELGDDAFRLRALGVTAVVRKPFSARRLVALVEEATACATAS